MKNNKFEIDELVEFSDGRRLHVIEVSYDVDCEDYFYHFKHYQPVRETLLKKVLEKQSEIDQ